MSENPVATEMNEFIFNYEQAMTKNSKVACTRARNNLLEIIKISKELRKELLDHMKKIPKKVPSAQKKKAAVETLQAQPS